MKYGGVIDVVAAPVAPGEIIAVPGDPAEVLALIDAAWRERPWLHRKACVELAWCEVGAACDAIEFVWWPPRRIDMGAAIRQLQPDVHPLMLLAGATELERQALRNVVGPVGPAPRPRKRWRQRVARLLPGVPCPRWLYDWIWL